jgi:metallo-beta-lactamase family protein
MLGPYDNFCRKVNGINRDDVFSSYKSTRAQRHGGHKAKQIEPLYTTLDALNSLEYFKRRVSYNKVIEVAPGIRATFLDAGHILGSASILLELEEGDQQHRLLFSGDLG